MRWIGFLLVLLAGLPAWSFARADAAAGNPDAVAVIIGNQTYSNADVPKVEYADRDAAAIRRYVIDVLGYDERNIIFVENATQGKLISLFGSADNPRGQLADWVREGRSDVFVYYSGHGVPGSNGEAYLLPADADPATIELNGYRLSQLKTNLDSIEARSVTVVLDACFSGGSSAGNLIRNASVMTRPASPVPAGLGAITWIAASGAEQLANWDKADKHGLFTEYFLRAVYGAADDPRYGGHGDGRITLGAAQRYLDEEMSYIARREYRRPQKANVAGEATTVLASLNAGHPPLRIDAPALPVAGLETPAPQVVTAQPRVLPQKNDWSASEARGKGNMAEISQDYAGAMRWFQYAADKGDAEAMRDIGALYAMGLGVSKNCGTAKAWFQKAVALGDKYANNWLWMNSYCAWN
jgi:hypothetical protein